MKKQTLFLLFLLPTILAAQTENLLTDKDVFEEKKVEYSKWLKASGLGKVLRVETVRVTEGAISLDLGFYTTNGDTVTIQWNGLKRQFEQQDRGVTLEEELFHKMLYFMEIKPTQGYVQLFNSYDTKKDLYVCFYRGIKSENGKVVVEAQGCKTVIDSITVVPANLSNLRTVAKGDIARKSDKTAVFERIRRYVEARYQSKPQECEFRQPKVNWLNTDSELYFTVIDLCKEVLDDETNPWWCSVLEPTCTSCRNCRKREYLEMYIRYVPMQNGYRIYVSIDAKIGSGWYQEVKRGAYKNMELDYKRYVEDYSKKFKTQLLEELRK